jgi:hypothetical protein
MKVCLKFIQTVIFLLEHENSSNVAMLEKPTYELTRRDHFKNRALTWSAGLAPVLLALPLPIVFLVLWALFGTTTAAAAFYIFMALLTLGIGFAVGVLVMIALFVYRNFWLKNLRARLAVDGIKTAEVDWFANELTTAERKSLKELDRTNRLLADAYRETLASRLTAARILKSSKDELLLVRRRENKLKYLKTDNSKALQDELKTDRERIEKVRNEADELRVEAETRLQAIEAAARRGTSFAGNEAALQRLTERTAQLPLALEAVKIEEQVRREIAENEPQTVLAPVKKCPVCQRTYADATLNFCLNDGADLIEISEEPEIKN